MLNKLLLTQPSGSAPPTATAPSSSSHLGPARESSTSYFWLAVLAALVLTVFATPAVRAHPSPPGCTGSGLGILLFTDSPDVHVGDTLNYSVTVFNGTGTGPLVCDATEIQAFVITPDGVSHPITLARTTLTSGQSDYYKNVVTYVVRSQDIQADATVRATAKDAGVIHQNDTNSQGGGNQGVNTEVSLPCIQLAVNCLGSVGENGAIAFTGTVTNCGNNTLVGVSVTNFVNGAPVQVAFITNLAIGQVASFNGSWIPANPCVPSTATFTAHGVDQFTTIPRAVTSTASTTCSDVLTPGIKITKVCPTDAVSPGQLLTFSGSVRNTGNVTLVNIAVVNDRPAANTPVFTVASLAPGATANFTGSYLAPTNCSVTDTLTVRAASTCGVAVTDSATATCPILTKPKIGLTVACPTATVLPGGSLVYRGTVVNLGDITLVNVTVVSDRPNAGNTVFTLASLAPGAAADFTSTVTVPASGCSVANTFTATGKDTCTVRTVTQAVSTLCNITTAPAVVVTLACPAANATTGGLITYTGTVRNSGNVTLNNVTVVNSQADPVTVLTLPSLAPGISANFTVRFTAPADACSVTSTVTAAGIDSCSSVAVTSTASATCPLLTTPALVLTQDCPTIPATPGALLTYSGTVRNSGNITVTNVVIVNNLSGTAPIFTTTTLAPGAVASFTGSYLAPTNCTSSSTSTVTGRSVCGVAVTAAVSSTCTILTTPQIAITANCPTGTLLPGGSLVYTGTVRNTGNITLVNVTVLSDRPAGNTTVFTIGTLAPGASANFTSTTVVPANACTVTTTFTGTGKDTCTQLAVSQVISTLCTVTTAPAIAVTLACPTATATAGGPITYTGTVRNSGNVTLNNVTVTDLQASPATVFSIASLAPGVSANFTASFTAPVDTCSVSSTVTATGTDNCSSNPVSSTAATTCPLLTTPSVVITQSCPDAAAIPGSRLTFSGTVRNSGNITITNVVVLNTLSGSTPVFTSASLAPGAVANFTGSFLAPTNCSVSSTSTVTGRSVCGVAVTHTVSATCTIQTTPAIEVTLACPINPPALGGTLTYSGSVSNSGNTTLNNILVVNSRTGATPIFTLATLAPGAVAKFTGSYVIPANCCIVSSTLTATGQGCDGRTASDTASSTCQVLTSPALLVTKVCTGKAVGPGERLTYTGYVTNTGNISLTEVLLVNNWPIPNSPVLGPITLAPGEGMAYTASYIVPPDFCGTDTVTAIGTACNRTVTNSVTTTCPITPYTPGLVVTKNCPDTAPPRGGQMIYTGTVANTGNITLVNVYVVSSQPLPNTAVLGPITLAPGESKSFTANFRAPTDCCEVPTTLNARGQDKCSLNTITAHISDVCPLLTTPALSITRVCPVTPVAVGGLYVFTGSVVNTGDVNLTNVIVLSTHGTIKTTLIGPLELAPGESEEFTGSYTVTAGSDPNTDTVSASGLDTCHSRLVSATADCSGLLATTRPVITSVTTAQGVATVTWSARNGTTYSLQSRAGSNEAWVTIPGNVTAASLSASKLDAMGPQAQRFYRVLVVQ